MLGKMLASPDEDGNVDKLNDLYKKAMSLPQSVAVVKQVTETLATLIKLVWHRQRGKGFWGL